MRLGEDPHGNRMVRINLLPIRQIKRRQGAVQELFVFAFSLLVLLLAIGVASGVIAHTIASLNRHNQELLVKKNSYNAIIKEIEELKQQKQNLEAKIDTIQKLKKGSQVAVRILDVIADLTPPNRMWLNSLQQSGGTLKLAGVALDNATIAQYMIGLSRSPVFASADLESSAQTEVAGMKLKAFTLSIGVGKEQAQAAPTADQQKGKKK